ncbi:hypothetical protein K443DRAFT_108857, partial [Laccaria amethystina LaAM-08-1]
STLIILRMANKKKRNITGLRNQSKAASHIKVQEAPDDSTDTVETLPTHPVIQADIPPSDNDVGWDAQVRFDSNKLCWEVDDEEDKSEDEGLSESEGDVEDEVVEANDDEWRSDGLHVGLMVLAIEIGDDPRDEDWIPEAVQRRQNSQIAKARVHPQFYQKGPDVGRKAIRTQCRYKNLLKGQQKLEDLGFMRSSFKMDLDIIELSLPEETPEINVKIEDKSPLISPSLSHYTLPISEPEDDVCVRQETPDPPVLEFDIEIRQESLTPPRLHFNGSRSPSCVRIREESVMPLPLFPTRKRKASGNLDSEDSDDEITDGNGREQQCVEEDVPEAESAEAWEGELDETLTPNAEIQNWAALRTQIKADLKKKHKSMPLSKINQLMILQNFATLRLKGYG